MPTKSATKQALRDEGQRLYEAIQNEITDPDVLRTSLLRAVRQLSGRMTIEDLELWVAKLKAPDREVDGVPRRPVP